MRYAIALALAAASVPAAAQVTINASSWVPPQHALTAAMLVPLCQDMEKATAGRVKCNVLPKHPVAPPQTFDAVRDGVIDLSFATHGYNPGRFVLTEAAEFPFMGNTATASSVAYQRIFERIMARHDEHKGVMTIAMFTHGPGVLYNTRRPVKELKDLQGMKVRVGAATVSDIMAALGTVPMLKPATESYELMSSGVADGTVMPRESPLSFKFVPLVKHVTFVPGGMYTQSFAWVMNPAKWNAISAADRKAIQPLFGEAMSRRSGQAWDAADTRGWNAIQEAKIPVVIADSKFIAEMKARTDPLERAWAEKKAKPKGVDGLALLRDLRTEIAKVSKEK